VSKEHSLSIGVKAPAFNLPDQNGEKVRLSGFSGRWVVLYFYPKDNTSGCTAEACDFTNGIGDFERLDCVVFGVSPDTVKSHRNFSDKHSLKVTLLSDPEHEMLEKYGVWQVKKMYGKEYYGVERTTFLIDPKGKIAHVWRKVKVKGHVDEVRKKLSELAGQEAQHARRG
jgi:peroxiredoxin Q/BCP